MLALMQAHQALVRIFGIGIAAALAVVGCGGAEKQPPASATQGEGDDNGSAEDEDEVMADLDSYLEEEGEDVSDDESDDDGGEDAADTEDKPRSTSKDRTEQIYGLIKAKRPSVANCYKMARKDDPKIGKKVAVKIVVNPDGSLKHDPEIAEDRTDISNEKVRQCAIDVVKSVEYPPHPKGMETTFTYPFGF